MGEVALAETVPVRDVWKQEVDFSDWLVSDQGIEVLGRELDLEIEDPEREQGPGDFRCDIVAHMKDGPNHRVVIENQFGKTDHDHLGKLLTYTAVHQAVTAIWIAEYAADEHRRVVDWLNDHTPPDVNFYLAELSAIRIEDSPVAPRLQVVCRPNVQDKLISGGMSDSERRRRQWRLAFWEEIHQTVRSSRPPFRLHKPGTDLWSGVFMGRRGFQLNMCLVPQKKHVRIELYIDTLEWKDAAYDQLCADKEAIEAEVGEPLKWERLPGKRSAHISLVRELDPKDEANRQAICQWFAEKMPVMYLAFKPRVAALKAPEDSGE